MYLPDVLLNSISILTDENFKELFYFVTELCCIHPAGKSSGFRGVVLQSGKGEGGVQEKSDVSHFSQQSILKY